MKELENQDIDDPDWIPAQSSTDSDSEEINRIGEPVGDNQNECANLNNGKEKKKRDRKGFIHKNQWHDLKNKALREKGKGYIGWERKNAKGKRGPNREERKLGPACISDVCKKSDAR